MTTIQYKVVHLPIYIDLASNYLQIYLLNLVNFLILDSEDLLAGKDFFLVMTDLCVVSSLISAASSFNSIAALSSMDSNMVSQKNVKSLIF